MAVPSGSVATRANMHPVSGPDGALVHWPSSSDWDCSGRLPAPVLALASHSGRHYL